MAQKSHNRGNTVITDNTLSTEHNQYQCLTLLREDDSRCGSGFPDGGFTSSVFNTRRT